MRISAQIQKARLQLPKAIKAIAEECTATLTRAAFEWIESATSIIPVWSGASHATFLMLAREIGFNLSIDTASNAPRRVNYGLRNTDTVFTVDATKGLFEFKYETRLPHLVYNEENNANIDPDPGLLSQLTTPGPYRFQERSEVVLARALEACDELLDCMVPTLAKIKKLAKKAIAPRGPKLKIAS